MLANMSGGRGLESWVLRLEEVGGTRCRGVVVHNDTLIECRHSAAIVLFLEKGPGLTSDRMDSALQYGYDLARLLQSSAAAMSVACSTGVHR